MNKTEFINKINSKSGLTKKECKLCLNAIIDIIKSALQKGESVTLSNFGKFKVSEIKEKTIYSFKSGTTEILKAHKTPTFKASDNLKEAIK